VQLSGATADGVTVVIPAWGEHARLFLRETVDSVLAQDARPRVLLVDNAAEPVLDVAGVDVVRVDDRRTVGGARNVGLAHTTTPYVMFWDADDVMLPGTVGALTAVLEAQPEVVAVAARILEEDGTDHGWPRPRLARLMRLRRTWALLHAVSPMFPATGAVLIRTEVLRAAGGFPDVDGGDDCAAALSLALRGRLALDDHPGRVYRCHSASISAEWDRAQLARHARGLRRSLRDDDAAGVLRAALPLVLIGQVIVATTLRPLRRRLRPRVRERAHGQLGPPKPARV
jgi:GT2 family glycosyltransferase